MEIVNEYVVKNQKKLRCGITTGTCATAAATACATSLLLNKDIDKVTIMTPKKISVDIPVFLCEKDEKHSSYYVIKDSGDDPDVTNQQQIHVCLSIIGSEEANEFISNDTIFKSDTFSNIFLDGGEGVGRVTKPGLEQQIGQSAINKVPRKMIFEAVGEVVEAAGFDGFILITVSVPKGRELSIKTFNGKLGIEGGISILGTSGIIEPMSEQAIVSTIETEIKQLAASGEKQLLVTPGNYGQVYASNYLGLDLSNSVKSSNYIGDTIDLAISYGFKKFLLVGNIGKLVKLAAGIFNTHSKIADGRQEIFATHAALLGGSKELVGALMECVNTDAMLDLLIEQDLYDEVLESIINKINEHIRGRVLGVMDIGVVLFSEKYGYLGMTKDANTLMDGLKERQNC